LHLFAQESVGRLEAGPDLGKIQIIIDGNDLSEKAMSDVTCKQLAAGSRDGWHLHFADELEQGWDYPW
jgi:hypothetical protein